MLLSVLAGHHPVLMPRYKKTLSICKALFSIILL